VIWWVVWPVLVVGTMVGAFFLGRSLWRKTVALYHEVVRLEEVAARLEVVLDARSETWVHPLAATEADLERWRTEIAERRAGRGARRAERHQRAYERWSRWWG